MMARKVLVLIFIIAVICIIIGVHPAGYDVFAAQPTGVGATQGGSAPKDGAYEYSGLDRRDPFAPLVSKREGGREKGVSPLESYEVAEIKVIAILWAKNKYYAVFSLPDGKSYTVTDGNKVGTHNGVITKIVKDSVVIKERVRDVRGVMSPRDIVLRLRGEEEE
jgi:Tfp pilus assembly protein PilP